MASAVEPLDAGTISAGRVLSLVRDGETTTRTELAQRTGLSRSTLAERVQSLLALGLLSEAEGVESTGGRPPATLVFNRSAGVVLVADLDAGSGRVAVSDLAATPLAERAFTYDATEAPEATLATVRAQLDNLLESPVLSPTRVWGVGVGWDGFAIPHWFGAHYDAPVLVDSHVNVMALGEHWTHWRDVEHLLYVTIGAGIECGIVTGRRVHRGAHGAAGYIAHVRLAGHDEAICRCGNVGCLVAVAGGDALAAQLTAAGLPASCGLEVAAHARAGKALALHAVRGAGRAVGEVLAECVNFFNPGAIVIGGELSGAPQQLLAGVREVVIGRSLPMATRDLRVASGRLGDRAGVVGAAVMVVEEVLSPANVDRAVQRNTR